MSDSKKIPYKSRYDIIDTTLQSQKEKSALKFLILLLLLTLSYEFGDELGKYFASFQLESPIIEQEMETKTIPFRRIQRFGQLLDTLRRSDLLLHKSVKEQIDLLKSYDSEKTKKMPKRAILEEIEKTLVQLSQILTHPLWKPDKTTEKCIAELKYVAKHLGLDIPESEVIPEITLGPKLIEELTSPVRDLFSFQ